MQVPLKYAFYVFKAKTIDKICSFFLSIKEWICSCAPFAPTFTVIIGYAKLVEIVDLFSHQKSWYSKQITMFVRIPGLHGLQWCQEQIKQTLFYVLK